MCWKNRTYGHPVSIPWLPPPPENLLVYQELQVLSMSKLKMVLAFHQHQIEIILSLQPTSWRLTFLTSFESGKLRFFTFPTSDTLALIHTKRKFFLIITIARYFYANGTTVNQCCLSNCDRRLYDQWNFLLVEIKKKLH